MTCGERDKNKPHKTILMAGETGTGKTKLINAMINYMLGVQREDKVWFEITDDYSDRQSFYSQTFSVTVYGFYLQESPIHLTIIYTRGYGDTRGVDHDKEIAVSFLSLCKSAEEIHEIHAVCLVIKATQNRIYDGQICVFDAVQSLFGRDIAENIVLLFTHSTGAPPKNVLTAVKEAEIKCAVNDKNRPVFFLFDNCQGETFHEECQMIQEQSWNLSFRGMTGFFKFLGKIKPITMQMIHDVWRKRKQLDANISKLQVIELKKNDLKQTQEESLVKKQREELQELEKEKVKLVIESFCCVETLQLITLNTDSLLTLQQIDFLIKKLNEINEPEKAETVKNIKTAKEKHRALRYKF